MMNRTLVIGAVSVLVAAGALVFFTGSRGKGAVAVPTANPLSATPTVPQMRSAVYTMEEVSRHSSKGDCWTVMDGAVYDLTAYVGRHPGGDAILAACGKDGTSLFDSRPKDGRPHSAKAKSFRETLKIGELAK